MIDLIVVGTGMYVCGRGTSGFGTILPAVMQAQRDGLVNRITVAGRTGTSIAEFERRHSELAPRMGYHLQYTTCPGEGMIDPKAYRHAIRERKGPGAVIISTPDHLHREMALEAIHAGKHVLVVKPLTPTVNEALDLLSAAEAAGVYGAVEFHKRWDDANLKMLDVLSRGQIGRPLFFHVEYSQRRNIPLESFSEWVGRTNIFQYLGVHYADLIHFVTGALPRRVLAIGQHGWLEEQGVPVHDAIQAIVEWDTGIVSTLLTSWVDPESSTAVSQQTIKVIGTEGRLESDQTNRGVTLLRGQGGVEFVNPYFCQPYSVPGEDRIVYRGYGIESVTQFLRDVGAITRGEETPASLEGRRPTFRAALASTAVVDAANLSIARGSEWVELGADLRPLVRIDHNE